MQADETQLRGEIGHVAFDAGRASPQVALAAQREAAQQLPEETGGEAHAPLNLRTKRFERGCKET